MKIMQINTSVNSSSTGRIAENIGSLLIDEGHKSFIAYGISSNESRSGIIKVGQKSGVLLHVLKTRFFDLHGFGSVKATRQLVKKIELIDPDLIHLHNIHGYYINIEVLFEYLKKRQKPVVWTFHDCWPFTGHCCYFDTFSCDKWKTLCFDCPNTHGYPKSWLIDNSTSNYRQKKELFSGLERMILVSPSEWLANHLGHSFLSKYEIKVINNGVDLDKFIQHNHEFNYAKTKSGREYILGVAGVWSKRKGLDDFLKLREILDQEIEIILVGLSQKHSKSLTKGIRAISRTESIADLASLYRGAGVFVNPTYVDNFPTTNLEALACGTPVVTYNTGGSPEAIDSETGRVVQKGDITGLKGSIIELLNKDRQIMSEKCRSRAEEILDSKQMSQNYLSLYRKILEIHREFEN